MRAAILGTGTALPRQRLTNAQLSEIVETSDAWIVERTGIRERRIADTETTASLAAEAGAMAIKAAGLSPDDIDLLVIATSTPEQPMPHTGAFVGDALGTRCGSFDLNAACAGFAFGLVTASALVTGGGFKHVLLIGSETMSRIVNATDRGTCILFGDGAGAVVLGQSPDDGPGVLSTDLGADPSATSLLEVPAGGSRLPTTAESLLAGKQYIHMNGGEVFKRAVRAVVESTKNALTNAGLTAADVAWFVPHQANARIIDTAAQRLGIPPERCVVNIENFGNTSTASIPLALDEAANDGRIKAGDIVVVTGFGAGMAWATIVLRWGRP